MSLATPGGTQCHGPVQFGSTPQPELVGDTIRLRPWRPDDIDWLSRACQDPDVRRWTTVPSPYTRADAAAFIEDLAPSTWSDGSAAHFAVVDRDSDARLASIGVVAVHRATGVGEIGYFVDTAARGSGIATGAVAVLGDWALSDLALERLEILVDPGNAPSIRVAERAGYRLERQLARGSDPRAERHDTLVFVRTG